MELYMLPTITIILFIDILQLTRINASYGLCGNDVEFYEYDTRQDMCCDGQIHDKFQFICCNGRKAERKLCQPGQAHCEERICCNNKLISKENNMCCEHNIIPLNDTTAESRNNLFCCGKDIIIDWERTSCCGRRPIQANSNIGCCDGEIFDKDRKRCKAGKILTADQNVCGGEIHNMTRSSCCGVKLNFRVPQVIVDKKGRLKLNPIFGCCGNEVMDPQKEKCCSDGAFPCHTIKKNEHIHCCGKGYFNSETESCINYTPVRLEQHEKKCGFHKIDTRTQSCCANKLPYDKDTQQCCTGSGIRILSKAEICCNGYCLKEDEICCQDLRPIQKKENDDDACCFDITNYRGITYKSKDNRVCRRGKLQRKNENGSLPCGPYKYYFPSRELCCGYHIYPKKDGRVDCTAIMKPQKIKATCGIYKINTVTKKCCGGRFPYKKSSKTIKCCSDRQLYDKRGSRCTKEGNVVSKLQDYNAVCRSRYYDGAIEEACVRKYGILAKVEDIVITKYKDSTNITLTLQYVKTLSQQNGFPVLETSSSLVMNIQTTQKTRKSCLNYYRKRSRKFMLFFDEPIKAKKVQIFENSSFYITKYTKRRYKDVTRGISKEFCKYYKL